MWFSARAARSLALYTGVDLNAFNTITPAVWADVANTIREQVKKYQASIDRHTARLANLSTDTPLESHMRRRRTIFANAMKATPLGDIFFRSSDVADWFVTAALAGAIDTPVALMFSHHGARVAVNECVRRESTHAAMSSVQFFGEYTDLKKVAWPAETYANGKAFYTRDKYLVWGLSASTAREVVGIEIPCLRDELREARHVLSRRVDGRPSDYVLQYALPRFMCDVEYTIESQVKFVLADNVEVLTAVMPPRSFEYHEAHGAYYEATHPALASVPGAQFRRHYASMRVFRSDLIPSYHSRSTRDNNTCFIKRVQRAEDSYERVFGCEVEVEFRTEQFRKMWLERHDDFYISRMGTLYERDGSLDESKGLEIITAPYTLGEIQSLDKSPIRNLFETLKDGIVESDRCGLHISCSDGAAGQWVRRRAAEMVSFLQPLFERLARRSGNRYAIYNLSPEASSQNRYAALSIRPKYSEVRIFKGATTVETVLEAVELCHALFMWCENPSMPVGGNIAPSALRAAFRSWIRRNGAIYPHLSKRLGGVESSTYGYTVDEAFSTATPFLPPVLWPEDLVNLSNNALL